jgi:hypothetical protein
MLAVKVNAFSPTDSRLRKVWLLSVSCGRTGCRRRHCWQIQTQENNAEYRSYLNKCYCVS